jgi:hypothetical protein
MTQALFAAGAFASVFAVVFTAALDCTCCACAAMNAGAHTTTASVTAREPNENQSRFLI